VRAFRVAVSGLLRWDRAGG